MFGNLLWDFAVAGVNHSLEGNGGPNCIQYIPLWQRWLETLIIVPLGVYGIYWSMSDLVVPNLWHRHLKPLRRFSISAGAIVAGPLTLSENNNHRRDSPTSNAFSIADEFVEEDEDTTRYSVLAAYSLVFGGELAYKMISKTGIFLLNPCHITTALQLCLLQMHSRKSLTCRVFRFHMYTMPGAILALAFPILNTRQLPGEQFIYFVQHLTILIIPLYLLYLEGAYTPEPMANIGWPVFSFCVMLLYHYVLLQPIGMYTEVNLNCIICPAVSDPFKTRIWRLFAVGHQLLAVPIITKLYCAGGLTLTTWLRHLFNPIDIDAVTKSE